MEILVYNGDGSISKFTEEMAVTAIKGRDHLREELSDTNAAKEKWWDKVATIRGLVYDFFNNEYEAGETKLTFQVSDINTLLNDIGSDTLKTLWTVKGRINFTVTNVEADSEDAARSDVEDNIKLDCEEGDLDDWDIDITDTDEQ